MNHDRKKCPRCGVFALSMDPRAKAWLCLMPSCNFWTKEGTDDTPWRRIDDAPRDRRILVLTPNGRWAPATWQLSQQCGDGWFDDEHRRIKNPTHFMIVQEFQGDSEP